MGARLINADHYKIRFNATAEEQSTLTKMVYNVTIIIRAVPRINYDGAVEQLNRAKVVVSNLIWKRDLSS